LTHTTPAPTTSLAASLAVNLTAAQQELRHAFELYEDALIHNKVEMLDALFWDSPHTLRYGAKENLNGYDDIKAFRAARPSAGLARDILDCHIVTFGSSMGVANITFRRRGEPRVGRQSQTWVKSGAGPDAALAHGWRVVSAHVSWMDL
jgi:hypothetical protein